MSQEKFERVVRIMQHRKDAQSPLLTEMLNVQRRYHADYVIPMPDMDEQPDLPPLTPALVSQAIDQPALTAAQVQPHLFCPPLDFTKDKGTKSREYARKRELALKHTHHKSKMRLQAYRMYRHMSGYATATMVVRPSWKDKEPVIEVRDPMSAYPEPKDASDMSRPADIGFIHRKSAGWIRATFPQSRTEVGGPIPPEDADLAELWEIVEWWDAEHVIWGIFGPSWGDATREFNRPGGAHQWLHTFPNRCGHAPVATMPRITLDRVATQIAHNTGIIDFMGRLLTLDMIAAERNVFPDRYIIGDQNQMVRIVTNGGEWADGRTGKTNILEGARIVGEMRSQPDPMTRAAYDTLERNFKVSTGMSSMQMGENGSNLRTGRALAEMYGVSVDPRVQELQAIAEHGYAELNESVLATWEHCFGEFGKRTIFAGFAGEGSVTDFDPARHVEGEYRNAVSYAIPGADVQGTTITLGQLYGTNAISLKTMRAKHPYIEDAELEARLVDSEQIERAMFDTVLQRAGAGELPITYLAKVAKAIIEGKHIADAIEAADEAARLEQAAQPPMPEDPALMAPPEAMPGLEAIGPGAEAMAALGAGPAPPPAADPGIGPTPGQVGLDQLMSAMRGGGAMR